MIPTFIASTMIEKVRIQNKLDELKKEPKKTQLDSIKKHAKPKWGRRNDMHKYKIEIQ